MRLSRTSVLIQPFQTASVTANISPPTGIDPSTFPVFSGFIQIESATETLHVTYLGVANALKNKQVTDNTSELFGVPLPALLDSNGNVQNGTVNYTFVGTDFPTLLNRSEITCRGPLTFFLTVTDFADSLSEPPFYGWTWSIQMPRFRLL